MNRRKSTKKLLIILAIITAVISVISVCLDFAKDNNDTFPTEYHEIIGLFKDGRVTGYTLNLENSKLEYYVDGSDVPYTYTVPDNDLFIADSREAIKSYSELTGTVYNVKADYTATSSSALQLMMFIPSFLIFGFVIGMTMFFIKKTKIIMG